MNVTRSHLSILIFIILFGASFLSLYATPLSIPGGNMIEGVSIGVTTPSSDGITSMQNFGFQILGFLKVFISGIALIYLVMIGVYMIVFSENEERIKTQRRQITYALIGFVFLNIPGTIYSVFLPSDKNGAIIGTDTPWKNTSSGTIFWDTYGFDGIFGSLIAFFRVFIFGVAVIMFTWGIFRMILSAGDEEAQKQGKNRLIYGAIALIFLGFVEFWSTLVAGGDFEKYIPTIGSKLFGITLFFAGPVAVFFLIWGAYYYITSGGEEERIKKGKNIIINTFIATLILIAALSFLNDLIKFQL